MECKKCEQARAPESIPYIVHESVIARHETRARWLIGAVIACAAALVACNAAWAWVFIH